MHYSSLAGLRRRLYIGASVSVLASAGFETSAFAADPDKTVDAIKTASPIKHVIIIVGENRSFDHVFATYAPKSRHEKVLNLLSQGIVNADGTPGKNFAKGHQFQITSAPNLGKFFISARLSNKALHTTLPAPDIAGVPAVSPLAFILGIPGGDPGLPPQDQFLFGTGGTGLAATLGPDTRITNVNTLPPGPFQLTGPTKPYDSFEGDTIHQYFQMYQQMDCAIDNEHVSRGNPTGCLHDLQSAITTAFFNMQQGDAPITKRLADQFTMSDNYHQPVMGGTGPDSIPLGFADQIFFGDSTGKAATPIASRIYNPDPAPGTLNQYTRRAQWFNCSDETAPGIKAIADYLKALPYEMSPMCDPGHFYPAVNITPAFTPGGLPNGVPNNTNPTNNIIPPVFIRSIGDELNDHNISWKYYGGGYNLAVAGNPVNGYCDICNPFEHQANYPSLRA